MKNLHKVLPKSLCNKPWISPRQLAIADCFAEANSVFLVITSAKILLRWLLPSKIYIYALSFFFFSEGLIRFVFKFFLNFFFFCHCIRIVICHCKRISLIINLRDDSITVDIIEPFYFFVNITFKANKLSWRNRSLSPPYLLIVTCCQFDSN